MKILITTDLFRPAVNGVVTSVLNLEAQLKRQGHEVRILTISENRYSRREGNVFYIKSVPAGIYPGIRIPISRGRAFAEELIAWKPDVVHSQCEFFTYGFASEIARKTGAVLLHTCHTLYEQYTKYIPVGGHLNDAVLASWMRGRLRHTELLIAPTKKVEHILRQYGILNRIAVVPTGICLEQFRTEKEPDRLLALRRSYGIKDRQKVVLSLGRLGFEKRIDELLRGFQQVLEKEPEAVFLIVGDGPAKKSLKELAAELGIGASVRFACMADPRQVPAFYQLADCFVSASTSETQGLIYAEALASGLPLICRADPCLNGVLEPGENGFAYEGEEELTERLCQILRDRTLRDRAKEKSRILSKNFATETFGQSILSYYMKRRKEKVIHESTAVYEKQANRLQERDWKSYADAKSLSFGKWGRGYSQSQRGL